jgi:hypothetical protein
LKEEGNMNKAVLSIGITALLLTVVISPIIYADNLEISSKDEMVDLIVEIYGFDEVNNFTVSLTHKQLKEVEKLFDSIRVKLNESGSDEDTSLIFEDAIFELDKYGLLGKFSVEEIQRLITEKHKKSKYTNIFDRLLKRYRKGTIDIENYDCQIAGNTTNTRIHDTRPIFRLLKVLLIVTGILPIGIFFSLVDILLEFLYKNNFEILYFLFSIITLPISIVALPILLSLALILIVEHFSPYSLIDSRFHGDIQFGYVSDPFEAHPKQIPSKGWIWTNGSNGIVEYNGTFFGQIYYITQYGFPYDYYYHIGATNFLGIKIGGFGGGYSNFIGQVTHFAIDKKL